MAAQLIIHSVYMRNFLSVGNDGYTYNITNAKCTHIDGVNGAGKTTILEALFFTLYHKSFRGVTLKQLVNSINKKDMETSVVLEKNGWYYKIIRTMPKASVTLFKSDTMEFKEEYVMPQSPDMEQIIRNIIGINEKTFLQTVVMASMGFDNFLELSVSDRRQIINQMLDLDVITKMVEHNKTYIKQYKNEIDNLQQKKQNTINQIESLENIIRNAHNITTSNTQQFDEHIKAAENNISNIKHEIAQLDMCLLDDDSNCPNIDGIQERGQALTNAINENQRQMTVLQTEVNQRMADYKFYHQHDTCDRCSQAITPEHKQKRITELYNECMERKKQYESSKHVIDECTKELSDLNKTMNTYNEYVQRKNEQHQHLQTLNNQLAYAQNQLNLILKAKQDTIERTTVDTSNEQNQILELNKHIDDIQSDISDLMIKLEHATISTYMLSDNGFKAQIIREYLPFINNRINQYLELMGADYSLELDEQFNETILSRYRHNFSYKSFSNGQRSRINFALLFTMREVAMMRSNISCNVLFIDEVADNANDADGVEALSSLLTNMNDVNISVITHRNELKDCGIFDRYVLAKMDGLFTTYEESFV